MSNARPQKTVFADAFAGCGGLSLGLMQAGLEGRFAIEHDQFAFETLRANLIKPGTRFRYRWPRFLPKEPISIASLLARHRSDLVALRGSIDLLVGGPPCQGFSSAGRRRHDDPRNELFLSYIKLIDLLQPRAVLIENVRGFTMDFDADGDEKNYSDILRQRLLRDFDVFECLLDLSLFGVPQSRTRYFLLALERGLSKVNPFDELIRRVPGFLRSLGLRAPISSRAAISDLELSRCGLQASRENAGFSEIRYGQPSTRYQRFMHEGAQSMSNLRLARHSAEISQRFGAIIETSHAEGRLNTTISEETRQRYGLKKRALRVLDPDRPSPTITSMPDDLIHYAEPRTLTVRENARLQSFPDWFEFRGKYTTGGHLRRKEVPRFTQVANAVPPLVARAIGEMLRDLLAGQTERQSSSCCARRRQSISQRVEVVA